MYVVDDDGTTVADSGDGILIFGTAGDVDAVYAPLKSLGMYIEAEDLTAPYATPLTFDQDDTDQTNVIHDGDAEDRLDFSDRVAHDTKPKELFSYVDDMGVEQRVVEETRTTSALNGSPWSPTGLSTPWLRQHPMLTECW